MTTPARPRHRSADPWGLVSLLILLASGAAADVRPPLDLRVVPESDGPATAGTVFHADLELVVADPAAISATSVTGQGWQAVRVHEPLQAGPVELPRVEAALQLVVIPFQATPTNPDSALRIEVTYAGHRYVQVVKVGPRAHARQAQGRRLASAANASPPQYGDPLIIGDDGGGFRSIPLQFTGRIVYTRDDGQVVGADNILVRIKDDDPIGSETIVEVLTNQDGTFNVGILNWEDGSDDPDLFLEVAAETDVVDVEDSGIFENNYRWDTSDNVIDDFTGTFFDFGTLTPADPNDFPAMHIFNAVVRAHRWIDEVSVDLAHVDAQWPEGGTVSFYNGDMHITRNSHWADWVIIHEYGHHFMEEESTSPSPDYCNGICDPNGNCGHCLWCPEPASVHWTEGVPNWLADAVTRDWDTRYGLAARGPISFERTFGCGLAPTNPLMTEGHVAALLRDIEDELEDKNLDGINDPNQPACARDDLTLHPAFIFTILRQDQPTTVTQFISDFRTQFPLFEGPFWRTCANISNLYTWPESEAPGVVAQLDSPTHPLGAGGNWPAITFEWEPAPDDASGVTQYSFVFGPAPQEPDMTAEFFNGETTWTSPPVGLGQYFLSLKARDCVGNWSDQWTFFGPFEVFECNGNGIIDACETAAGCGLFPGLCGGANCGLADDCDGNGNPDECDIASGALNDCNANGIPDICEAVNFKDWLGCGADAQGNPLCTWHQSAWEGGTLPAATDNVCIDDDPSVLRLEHSGASGVNTIASLGTTERFLMSGGALNVTDTAGFYANLEQTGGTLNFGGDVTATQGITWHAGFQDGAGTTYANWLDLVGSGVRVLNRDMELTGWSRWLDTGQLWIGAGAVLTNQPGALFEQHGDTTLSWNTQPRGVFVNRGTYAKVGGAGRANIQIAFNNDGVLSVDSGELSLNFGGAGTGLYTGPGTLRFAGQTYSLAPGSDIDVTNVEVAGGTLVVAGDWSLSALTQISGTTSFAGPASVPVISFLDHRGGTITGTDDIGVFSTASWTGGTIAAGGDIEFGGPLTLSGTGVKILARDAFNYGGADWIDNGQFWIGEGATFNNPVGSIFDDQSDAQMSWHANPRGTFQNDGTYRKSAGTTRKNVQVPFNNDGLVDVQVSELSLNYGGVHTGTFSGAGGLRFAGQNHDLASSSVVDIANVAVAAGNVDVRGEWAGSNLALGGGVIDFSSGIAMNPQIGDYSQTSGTLTGSDNIDVSGTATWSGGTLDPNGRVDFFGPLHLTSPSVKLLNRDAVSHAATTWSDGQFWIGRGATFLNPTGALCDSQTDSQISWTAQPRGTFRNAGEYRKSAGAGRQNVTIPFHNEGLIDVQSGELSLNFGGTHTGRFQGTGAVRFGGDTHELTPASQLAVDHASVAAGTVDVHGEIDLGATLVVTGGLVSFRPDATMTRPGGAWTVAGGTLDASSGATLYDLETLNLTGGTLAGDDGIRCAALLDWSGGTLLHGPDPNGDPGDFFANGAITLHGTAAKILRKRLELRGAATWTDTGQLWIGAGGLLRVIGGSTFESQTSAPISWTVARGRFDNQGTFRKTGSAARQDVGVPFDNGGQVEVLAGTLSLNGGGAATGRFEGPGTLRFGGDTYELAPASALAVDSLQIAAGSVDVHGEVDLTAGLQVSGGTATLHADAVMTDPGTAWTLAGGTLDASSSAVIYNIDGLTMSGGTLRGDDALGVDGPFDWSGGTLLHGADPNGARGDLFANGPVNLFGSGSKQLRKRMEIRGAATWTDNGQLWVGEGGLLRVMPGATFDIQNSATISWTVARGSVENYGVFRKLAPGATSVGVPMENGATVELLAGDLRFSGGGYRQFNASALTRLDGGILSATSPTAAPLVFDAGRLTGVGAVNGRVTSNGATVAPGFSAGVLAIGENYIQSGGAALEIEVGGPAPGTDHDQLVVAGSATLAGELRVVPLNGFVPQIGDSFVILTAASVTGAFDTTTGVPPAGIAWEFSYTPTEVVLRAVQPDRPSGDVDGDCDVDFDDLLIVLGSFSDPGPLSPGDADGDGDCDLDDLLIVLQNFGDVC